MKSLKVTILAGVFTALFGAPVMGATTLLSDAYGTATATKGFAPDSGVNIGINPPTLNRMGGSIAQTLRYHQTITNRASTKFGISGGRLRVETEGTIGRFTFAQNSDITPFNFGSALGIPNATPANPVSYDVKVSMRNDAVNSSRFSLGIGTVEGDANTWDFGVQLYRANTTEDFYTIQKRFDIASTGLATDHNGVMATTAAATAGTVINFLIRVTDAGRETTSYSSRVQVSIDNGATWIYDTDEDAALVNGFRFDGTSRFFSFDQAPNSGINGGNVHYDNFSLTWNSGPRTWNGGGENDNWNNATNWAGATPVNGSALIFNGTSRQLNTNNINNLTVPWITFSNGVFDIYGNALTVNSAITNLLGNNTISNSITLGGDVRLESSADTLALGNIAGSGQNLTVGGAGNVWIGGAITTGTGGLTKESTGTLTIGGASDYTGTTTISAGTLALVGSGSIGGSSSIVLPSGVTLDATARDDGTFHLAGGQTLSGNGTVNGNAAIGGTLSPSGIGSLTTGSQTWNSGGQLNWEVSAATGTAGVDWDSIVVNGTLDIVASRSNPFVINMSGDAAIGFDNSVEHSWDVVTTTGGISTFDPAAILVVAPGFDVGATGGFGVRVVDNTLQVFFGEKPVVVINNAAKAAAFGDLNLAIGGEGVDFSVTGGTAPVLGYQWKQNGVILGNDANISGANTPTLTFAKVYGTNAGNYSITVWNAAGSTTSSDIALSVTKANQHIVATSAPEQNYGDSVTLSSYFVSRDNSETPTGVTLNYSLDSGGSIASINNGVLTFNGVGTVTVRAAAPETPDYNAGSDVTGDVTAGTRTLTITPDATSRAYGDANPVFTVSFTGFALGETLATSDVTGADSLTASSTANGTTVPGVETITVDNGTLAGLSSSHYDFTTATGILTITNRALTITATAASKTFGDADPTLTWTTNGFVNGDESLDLGEGLTVLTGTPVLSRDAGENAGTYAITVDTNGVTVNTNLYVLQKADAIFTINKATPTVAVISLLGETYNGGSHPTTASVTGVGGADLGAATVTYTPGGASAPVDAGDYDVEGSFAGNENYNAATGSGSIHIGKASVDPVVTVANKTYDGTTEGSIDSRNLTGVFGGDDVSLSNGTATFADATVGTGKSVSVTGLSLTGTKSGNYDLSSTSATISANITPASVDPEITASNKAYDGTTGATIATRSLNGVLGTDDVTLTDGTATFDTASVGDGKTVTAVDLELSGADSANYQLSATTAETTANITAASVTPQITAENKVYDGTTAATISSSLVGVIGGDDVTLTIESATFADANAGIGKTVTATGLGLVGADSGNYQLTSTTAQTTADISQATPVITWGPLTPIITGTTLASTLDASADVAGSFAYFKGVTLVDGTTVLPIGTHTLEAQFTPADSANYSSVSLNRLLSVTDVPDTTTPVLKILGPKSLTAYTTSSLLLTGTVYDAVGPFVDYTLNGNPAETAILQGVAGLKKASNYTATLFPVPGTNTLVVTGKDLAGNTTNITIKFYYHSPSGLVIQTNLNGEVITTNGVGAVVNTIPASLYLNNNTNLYVGRTYTLKALETGAPSYILTNWTATWNGQATPVVLQTNNLTCTFEMKEGMVLSANYISNPFYRFGGVYNGLFSESTGVEFESAGFITVKVTPKLTFSAKLLVDGNSVSIAGKLKLDGTGTGVSKTRIKADKPELTLNLALDFAGQTDTVSGTVVQPTGSTNWTANLLAHRAPWTLTNELEMPLAFTNSYTMLFPGFDTAAEGPSGTGSASVRVDIKGKAITGGVAADMQAIKQTVLISKDGWVPFFSPMYKVKRPNALSVLVPETEGFVMGWLQLTNNNGVGPLAPAGQLHWIKTGWTNSTYAAGFTNAAKTVQGSLWAYDALAPQNALAGLDPVLIDFTEGDLGAGFSNTWDVTVKSTFAPIKLNTYAHGESAAIVPKYGVVKGKFTHPSDSSVVKYQGAILQNTLTGGGAFQGPTNGGKVTIGQAPVGP